MVTGGVVEEPSETHKESLRKCGRGKREEGWWPAAVVEGERWCKEDNKERCNRQDP
jgi:hypothetical protein